MNLPKTNPAIHKNTPFARNPIESSLNALIQQSEEHLNYGNALYMEEPPLVSNTNSKKSKHKKPKEDEVGMSEEQ